MALYNGPCIDRAEVMARGWTPALMKRFLPTHDKWVSVKHWKNFCGKPLYVIERVMMIEHSLTFRAAFEESVARRKLTPEQRQALMAERKRSNDIFRAWLGSITPRDIALMVQSEAAVERLEGDHPRDFRAPGK